MNGISLFSYSGIGEYYLHRNNIHIKAANKLLTSRAELYELNYPNSKMIVGDICLQETKDKLTDISKKENCEFLIATPPCQGFSTAGSMDSDDTRNLLTIEAVKFIKMNDFKYILLENVPRYFSEEVELNGIKQTIPEYLKSELKNYQMSFKVVNSKDYDTPQVRKRAIVLLTKRGLNKWEFPDIYTKIPLTLKEAIGHLPSLESGEKSNIPFHNALTHNDRHILWMRNTPTGKSAFENPKHFPQKENGERIKAFPNTYKRMSWDEPAPTVTMNNGCLSSQNTVHPGQLKKDGSYSDARVLTIREIMIITGLDDNWKWNKTKHSIIRDVLGECVPPKLIYHLTKSLKPIYFSM